MAVSEMQIELLLRPSMADFQRAVFKVADKLQRDQLAINVQEIEKGFRDGQKAIPSAYAALKYYRDDDPDLRGLPPGKRSMERQTLNKGVREVLRAIRWYRKHPNATERDLMQIRKVLRDFPQTLDIRAIPTLVLWGDVFTMLSRAQSDAKFDLDLEEDEADDNILNPRQPLKPEDDTMLPNPRGPGFER
jgi:hypothetical protein